MTDRQGKLLGMVQEQLTADTQLELWWTQCYHGVTVLFTVVQDEHIFSHL